VRHALAPPPRLNTQKRKALPRATTEGRTGESFPKTIDTSQCPSQGAVEKKFSQQEINNLSCKPARSSFVIQAVFIEAAIPRRASYTTAPGATFNAKRYSVGPLPADLVTSAARYAVEHARCENAG
jgi:hypothetical protein